MDIATINLKFTSDTENEIMVTEPLWKQWNLSDETSYSIYFGDRYINAKVTPIDGNEYEVHLPPKTSKELSIPFPKKIQATIDHTLIRLGPLIGLLTTKLKAEKQKITTKNNGKEATLFKKMLSSKENSANYTFLFTPSDVNWSTNTILGSFMTIEPDNVKRWKQFKVPIPDVIYNRTPNRKTERSAMFQTFFKKIELHKSTKLFNPYFFNKDTIHELLKDNLEIAEYLPATYLSPTTKNIEDLIKRHKNIYLKPKNGSGGLGIYRIGKLKNRYFCNTERELTVYKSLKTLLTTINFSKEQNYLAQQGISLIKYKGRRVDFRINLNKNIENKWIITAIGGKAAGKGSATTHVRLGGEVYSSDELFKYGFKEKASTVVKDMEEAVIKLASSIELAINKPLGELGFDIGVDTDGRVWMLEANSLPGRSIFKHPSLEGSDKNSINLLFEYAYYLSGFTKKN